MKEKSNFFFKKYSIPKNNNIVHFQQLNIPLQRAARVDFKRRAYCPHKGDFFLIEIIYWYISFNFPTEVILHVSAPLLCKFLRQWFATKVVKMEVSQVSESMKTIIHVLQTATFAKKLGIQWQRFQPSQFDREFPDLMSCLPLSDFYQILLICYKIIKTKGKIANL